VAQRRIFFSSSHRVLLTARAVSRRMMMSPTGWDPPPAEAQQTNGSPRAQWAKHSVQKKFLQRSSNTMPITGWVLWYA